MQTQPHPAFLDDEKAERIIPLALRIATELLGWEASQTAVGQWYLMTGETSYLVLDHKRHLLNSWEPWWDLNHALDILAGLDRKGYGVEIHLRGAHWSTVAIPYAEGGYPLPGMAIIAKHVSPGRAVMNLAERVLDSEFYQRFRTK